MSEETNNIQYDREFMARYHLTEDDYRRYVEDMYELQQEADTEFYK